VNQDYEEANNFTNSVAAIPAGQDGKWDFALEDNNAPSSTSYCFRVVKSDNSELDFYTSIPEITTAEGEALTFTVTHTNFPNLSPGTPVFATSTLAVNTDSSTGWVVTAISGGDFSVLTLEPDHVTAIPDQTYWDAGAATTTPGNAARISSFSNSGNVLAFRVMTASGTPSFRAPSWWGTVDSYADNANTLWAGFGNIFVEGNYAIGRSSHSSGGSPALNTVMYYVNVASDQPLGTYSGTVLYTASVNP
jgi:hypothetical protein